MRRTAMSAPRHSTERYGLGQSGYTAGRVEGDRGLPIEGRNASYPRTTDGNVELDEQPLGLGLDERFVGCGGRRWTPEDEAPNGEDNRRTANPHHSPRRRLRSRAIDRARGRA